MAKRTKKNDPEQKNANKREAKLEKDTEFGSDFGSANANRYNEGGAQSGTKK